MKETETQKAIEAESDVYAKYDPFGDYKHLSIAERSRLISAKTQAYVAGHIAGRSKALEEKEKEIERLKKFIISEWQKEAVKEFDLIKSFRAIDKEFGDRYAQVAGSVKIDYFNQKVEQFKTENNL